MRSVGRDRSVGKDPWRHAPVSELQDQVLPRWFVLVALAMVVVALVVVVAAYLMIGRERIPVAARRPPPEAGLTTAVGAYSVGPTEPVPVDGLCPTLDGTRVAGEPADRAALASALRELCGIRLDAELATRLNAFARDRGVVRFAQFEVTGVDSTAELGADPPRILINARFARLTPALIAPLVAHDVTFLAADPALAQSALQARQVEAEVCDRIFGVSLPPGGCRDAHDLLRIDDPLAALRAVGFR